jgi:glutamyl-tRNA synthetase
MNAQKSNKIRTRFAPSPTGFLHVGGARTALFNLLFAQKYGGKFLLRIEDTDAARSSKENVQQIIDDLQWLGLNWDEEIIFQSRRISTYQDFARQLVETDHAYFCFCTAEELAAKRKQEDKSRRMYLYDGTCRKLTVKEVKSNLEKQLPYVIRFKVPRGITIWSDVIHGKIIVSNNEIDDFVLLRSDGSPTYQLAAISDDHAMNITHIIRGDDHLSNTSKQILLYEAFGWQKPEFAHLPLILAPDKKRLSKRHGATSVGEFRERGFLPQALTNYLALLGWSPGDDSEIMSIEELKEKFSLGGISKKGAIFDEAKLTWMNSHYIKQLPDTEILTYVQNYISHGAGAQPGQKSSAKTKRQTDFNEDYLTRVISSMKDRANVLPDFVDSARYFFEDPKKYEPKGVNKYLKNADIWIYISEFTERMTDLSEYNETSIETLLRSFAEEKGISAAKIIHPVRLALTGKTASPGLFEMMDILGKETVSRRLRFFIAKQKKILKQADIQP